MTAQDVNGYEDSSMFILNTKETGEALAPGFNESQMFILNTRILLSQRLSMDSAVLVPLSFSCLAGVASFSEYSDDLNLLGAADSS